MPPTVARCDARESGVRSALAVSLGSPSTLAAGSSAVTIRPAPPSAGANARTSAVAKPGTFGTFAIGCQPVRSENSAFGLSRTIVGRALGSADGSLVRCEASTQPPAAAATVTPMPARNAPPVGSCIGPYGRERNARRASRAQPFESKLLPTYELFGVLCCVGARGVTTGADGAMVGDGATVCVTAVEACERAAWCGGFGARWSAGSLATRTSAGEEMPEGAFTTAVSDASALAPDGDSVTPAASGSAPPSVCSLNAPTNANAISTPASLMLSPPGTAASSYGPATCSRRTAKARLHGGSSARSPSTRSPTSRS